MRTMDEVFPFPDWHDETDDIYLLKIIEFPFNLINPLSVYVHLLFTLCCSQTRKLKTFWDGFTPKNNYSRGWKNLIIHFARKLLFFCSTSFRSNEFILAPLIQWQCFSDLEEVFETQLSLDNYLYSIKYFKSQIRHI